VVLRECQQCFVVGEDLAGHAMLSALFPEVPKQSFPDRHALIARQKAELSIEGRYQGPTGVPATPKQVLTGAKRLSIEE